MEDKSNAKNGTAMESSPDMIDCNLGRNLSMLVANRETDGPSFKTVHRGLRRMYLSEDPSRIHKRIRLDSSIASYARSNISFVNKLKIAKELDEHSGCVNSIEWNHDGSLVITGSDDCTVNIWSAANKYKLETTIRTGHYRNIFSAKFVPFSADLQVVSCGMDGEIRFHDLTKPKEHFSMLLAGFNSMAYKVFFVPESPQTFLSTHQDGSIRLFDLRMKESDPTILLQLKSDNRTASANSLAFSPLIPSQLIMGGADPYMRLHDLRFLNSSQTAER